MWEVHFLPVSGLSGNCATYTNRAEVALHENKRCGVAGIHGIVFLSQIRLTIEKDFRRLRHVLGNLWTHWGSNSSLEKRPMPGQGVT
jgi:hypothetical protein